MRFNLGNAEIVTCAIPAAWLQERSGNPDVTAASQVYSRNAAAAPDPARISSARPRLRQPVLSCRWPDITL